MTSTLLHNDLTTAGNNTLFGVLSFSPETQQTMSCAIEFLSRVTLVLSLALDLPDRSVMQKTSSKLGIYI